MLTDLEKSSLLEVINSHKSDEIIEVLKQQPEAIRAKVEEVCVDMWGGFPKVIKAVFQNAAIVIDRFHVMKLVNKALNKIRLKLGLTGLKNKLLLLKNHADLSELESSQLAQLFQQSSFLEIAYRLKEELRQIYESSLTVKAGIKKIKQWLIYARLIFGSVADTLNKHLSEIANYFLHRTTSSVTEGLNTKLKLILRQSYGFTNFTIMREKLLACLFK